MEESRSRRQAAGTGIGVGGSSVLAVFVVLCLTTFAVLSLVSARADLRLSRKAAEAVAEYYEADARGQLLLSRLAGLTGDGERLPAQARELRYVTDCQAGPDGAILVTFHIPISESQTLAGEADIAPVLSGEAPTLLRYQVVVEESMAQEDPLDLWTGSFPASLS